MYFIGLDIHKKTISYCVKEVSGQIHSEGTVPATRPDLDTWMKTIPQPWSAAMEATIFTGWIYDYLLPHAAELKVAQSHWLRRKTTESMLARSRTAYAVTSCRNAIWSRQRFGIGAARCAIVTCWYGRWCR